MNLWDSRAITKPVATIYMNMETGEITQLQQPGRQGSTLSHRSADLVTCMYVPELLDALSNFLHVIERPQAQSREHNLCGYVDRDTLVHFMCADVCH